MSHQLDSTDYLIEQRAIDLDQEAARHARKACDQELHICLGDSWDLIQAKLADYEATINARLDRIERRLAEYGTREKAAKGGLRE